jgi:hypothetical protein
MTVKHSNVAMESFVMEQPQTGFHFFLISSKPNLSHGLFTFIHLILLNQHHLA